MRREILKIHTRGKPISDDVDFEEIVERTEGFAGSHIEGICQQASLIALREFIDKVKDVSKITEEQKAELQINMRHFNEALGAILGEGENHHARVAANI